MRFQKFLVGTIELHGHRVPLLMYADDLLTANTCNLGLQQQFGTIEKKLPK